VTAGTGEHSGIDQVPKTIEPNGAASTTQVTLRANRPSGDDSGAILRCPNGNTATPGMGYRLAAKIPGVLVDPAEYAPQAATEQETLFDYDDWLTRQQAAGVPLAHGDVERGLTVTFTA
jgi:hypothetical protein